MREDRRALIVGVDDYPVAPLEGCVTDAVKLSELLEVHYNGDPNFEVKSLLSSKGKVKKSHLKAEIEGLFNGDPNIALLYFAGHGFIDSYGGYIVTPDFERYDEGVSMRDIMQLANNSKAKDKIIILDCCYSGQLAIPSTQTQLVSELGDGVTILTSSRNTEISEESKSGVFSSLLIDAIGGQCADLTGNVLPSNVYAYIDRALGTWSTQRPIFKSNVSRFISLRKVKSPISIHVLRNIVAYFSQPDFEYPLDPSFEFTEPVASKSKVKIFKELQKMESVGLVVPVGEEHMYFAAMNNKSCRLTTLGKLYWNLVKSKRI